MSMKDKLLGIVGKDKYINKTELSELVDEFGEEVGNKVYEIAGKDHRLSTSELVEVLMMLNRELKKEINEVDIQQNRTMNAMKKQLGNVTVGELGYLGENIHAVRGMVEVLSKDVIRLADRIKRLESGD